MPLYEIEQYEIHVKKHRVEAVSAAAAIVKLRNGQADLVEGSSESSGICEHDGLRVNSVLAIGLRTLGMLIGQRNIPSIHSIKQIA